jgi:hypothetical protein
MQVPISVAIPAAMSSAPAIVTRGPNLGSSLAAAPEETNTPAENGTNVSPGCSITMSAAHRLGSGSCLPAARTARISAPELIGSPSMGK